MAIAHDRTQISRILVYIGPLVTLAISPWMSYDPVNVPKMAVLVIGAVTVLALLMVDIKNLLDPLHRPLLFITGFFLLDLIVILFAHIKPFEEHFFGTFGRNTGLLTYLSLLIAFLASAVSFRFASARRLLWALIATGFISALYGLIQNFGWDPFKWVNSYSPVFGFVGNPDFQSSLLGICGVVVVALLLGRDSQMKMRAALGVILLLLLFVILRTKAQQGFLVLGAGCAVVLFVFILKNQRIKWLTIPYLVVGTVTSALVVAGMLNKGPLGRHLFKISVTFRGDYWRAGWKMTTQHPVVGVGIDSYGDWYRASRTTAATLRRGPDIVSNAAHNVLLDFSSNGGFPFLIVYLLIVGLVAVSAVRFIRRSKSFDAVHAALLGAWIAYQAQSMISLNQLGIAVWGWILSGALIAYELHSRQEVQTISNVQNRGKAQKGRNVKVASKSPATSLAISLGLIVGLILALPPFIADAKFRSSLKSGSANILQAAATRWPMDDQRLLLGMQVMDQSKLGSYALNLARIAVKHNPRNFDAWRVISLEAGATPAEKSEALQQMKVLDPHNPTVK